MPPTSRPPAPDVADALRRVPLFAELSDDDVAWIVAEGDEVHLAPGEALFEKGEPVERMYVGVEGTVEARRDGAGAPAWSFEPGKLYGVVPFSRMQTAPTVGRAVGDARVFYGASEGLKTLLVEREAPGGQAGTSSNIENYLGFPVGLTGADLTRRGVSQAKKFGAEILTPAEVGALKVQRGAAAPTAGPQPAEGTPNDALTTEGAGYKVLAMADGSEVAAKVVLVATGVSYRTLDVPGLEALTGRGVYYGASTSEALSCRDEDVYIVGGGNSAGQAAMYFSRNASQVRILVRGDGLAATMSRYLIDQIDATSNISVHPQTRIAAVHGDGHLDRITLRDGEGERDVGASSLFIFIGAAPRTDWLDGTVQRHEHGFVLTGPDLKREAPADGGVRADGRAPWRVPGWPLDREPYLLETSVPGVLCGGDVRHQIVKRVASAVGEGSIAVQFTHRYLAES